MTLTILCCGEPVHPQDQPVPPELQAQLFQKVLTFNRAARIRSKSVLTIGILFQRTFRASNLAREGFMSAALQGQPAIRYVPIDLSEVTSIADVSELQDMDALYVSPLRAYSIESLTRITRDRKILTFTGIPEYLDRGLSVSIGLRGERPEIIINLNAAREEGADFSSQLLKLSKVIQ